MANDALVGLAVTSHDDAVLNTSTFSSVSAPSPHPRFASSKLSGANLVVTGTNGVSGWKYFVLTSTNLTSPLAAWPRAATNSFDASGGFAFTNPVSLGAPRQFFALQLP
jgi:hypothetical protein